MCPSLVERNGRNLFAEIKTTFLFLGKNENVPLFISSFAPKAQMPFVIRHHVVSLFGINLGATSKHRLPKLHLSYLGIYSEMPAPEARPLIGQCLCPPSGVLGTSWLVFRNPSSVPHS